MDRLFFMHDYAAFALWFLKQKDSITLLQNHVCCKQSQAVPTPGESWTVVIKNNPPKLGIFRFMEKAKAVRCIDLKRTHQRCHRAMSYENTNRLLCQLLRKYRPPDNNLHWLGTATVPGMWPWLSNHVRTTFKSHVVQGQWAVHACLQFELSPSKPSKILSTGNTSASSWCFTGATTG